MKRRGERARWIYGAAAVCPGYCELAAFWSCQSVLRPPCLCRDSVRVHTCEESRATDGLACFASPRRRTQLQWTAGPQLLAVIFLHPSGLSHICSSPPRYFYSSSVYRLFEPPLHCGADRQSNCASVKRRPGSSALLIYEQTLCEWHHATEKVPPW